MINILDELKKRSLKRGTAVPDLNLPKWKNLKLKSGAKSAKLIDEHSYSLQEEEQEDDDPKSEESEGFCRLCLSVKNLELFEQYTRDLTWKFLRIKVQDDQPNQICDACTAQLEAFANFHTNCLKNQEKIAESTHLEPSKRIPGSKKVKVLENISASKPNQSTKGHPYAEVMEFLTPKI